MTLRVAGISIKDVLGIKFFSVEPGKVTRITGRNGSMKTSIQQAMQAALGGGSLGKLAHVEAGRNAEPEVVLVLKGDREHRIEKKGDKTARVTARVGDTQAFEDVGRPQAWLSSIYDARGCNIVQLLKAPDKDVATLILEALPLDIDRRELTTILGDFAKYVRALPKGLHALEELGYVREDIFTARTGVNRDKDGAKKTAEDLRRSLPQVMPEMHDDTIRDTRAERDALATEITQAEAQATADETAALAAAQHERDAETDRLSGEFKAFAAKTRADLSAEVKEVEAEAERRIAAIRAEVAAKTKDLSAAAEEAIEAKRTEGDAALDVAENVLLVAQDEARQARARADLALRAKRDQLRTLEGRLATLESERDQAQRAAGLAEHLKSVEKKEAELKAEADRMTACLEGLDQYRLRLAKTLPVPGLEISGQEVRVNGIPWTQLNKGQRVEILVKVSVLRAAGRPLPLIFVDDAETLDTEHLELLERELAASGVQAVISRVGDTDLEVLADGEPARVGA